MSRDQRPAKRSVIDIGKPRSVSDAPTSADDAIKETAGARNAVPVLLLSVIFLFAALSASLLVATLSLISL